MNMPVEILQTEQGPSYDGAILAMVGCGEYKTIKDAAEQLVNIRETVYPEKEAARNYEDRYQIFKSLYPALKNVFRQF